MARLGPPRLGPGWFQDRGETVFAAFAGDSDSFGSADKSWKIGRFAELEDPERNRIELWEPNAASIARDPGAG